jgi:hypothetical protein
LDSKEEDMIRCKTCDTGELLRKKKYRMSGIVVFIGYVLLMPSVLGMLIGAITLFATGSGTGAALDSIRSEAQEKLENARVPPTITTRVLEPQLLTEADLASLTPTQRETIDDIAREIAARRIGAGIGAATIGGASLLIFVMSLVGGLLGWLLVMKKKVLQCTSCGAVTAAG